MTDRQFCRRCIHSYFDAKNSFKYCNYLEDTGRHRPHDGDECFGFEEGRKCRRRSITLDDPVKKSPDPVSSSVSDAQAVKRAARKITRERNSDLDEAVMYVQHMGDNITRCV